MTDKKIHKISKITDWAKEYYFTVLETDTTVPCIPRSFDRTMSKHFSFPIVYKSMNLSTSAWDIVSQMNGYVTGTYEGWIHAYTIINRTRLILCLLLFTEITQAIIARTSDCLENIFDEDDL